MSTFVTVSNPSESSPIIVHVEEKKGAQWVSLESLRVGLHGSTTVLVHGYRRFVVEEVPHG